MGRRISAGRGALMGKGARGRPARRQSQAPHLHFVLGMEVAGSSLTTAGFGIVLGPHYCGGFRHLIVRHTSKHWIGDFYSHRLSIGPENAFANMYFTTLTIGRRLP